MQSFKADLTLKDTSSVANIAISSNQPWDTQIRQKYMLNGIQSVMVRTSIQPFVQQVLWSTVAMSVGPVPTLKQSYL